MIRALFAAAALAASLVAAPTAGADPVWDLMAELPGGFGPGNCQPAGFDERSGITARVRCGQNTEPGGPSGGNFALFANFEAMRVTFNGTLRPMGAGECPGGTPELGPTHDRFVVTCGTEPDGPRMMFMLTDELILGVVFGPSLEALTEWAGSI